MGYQYREPKVPFVPNCATPETEYEIEGSALGVTVKIRLGKSGMWDRLTDYQKQLVQQRLHDAVLPAVELIYAFTWDDMWAGKDEPPYPMHHADLHKKRVVATPKGQPHADR